MVQGALRPKQSGLLTFNPRESPEGTMTAQFSPILEAHDRPRRRIAAGRRLRQRPCRRFGHAGRRRSRRDRRGAAPLTENTSPIATGAGHGSDRARQRESGRRPGRCRRAAAAAAAAVAAQQKPFAEVVKDAKEQPGFFNVYSKDEKGLAGDPAGADRSSVLPAGEPHAGHRRARPVPSPMLRSYIVEFHRLGNLVQLIAKNTQFIALAGHAACARSARIDQRQPAGLGAGRQPAASGAEVGTDRAQSVAVERSSRRVERARVRRTASPTLSIPATRVSPPSITAPT